MWYGDIFQLLIKVTFFHQICPKCNDRMKYMRKINGAKLYTCFVCYKSWIKKDKNFVETKLETR